MDTQKEIRKAHRKFSAARTFDKIGITPAVRSLKLAGADNLYATGRKAETEEAARMYSGAGTVKALGFAKKLIRDARMGIARNDTDHALDRVAAAYNLIYKPLHKINPKIVKESDMAELSNYLSYLYSKKGDEEIQKGNFDKALTAYHNALKVHTDSINEYGLRSPIQSHVSWTPEVTTNHDVNNVLLSGIVRAGVGLAGQPSKKKKAATV
jgi:hypothetical protein